MRFLTCEVGIRKDEVVRFAQFQSLYVLKYFIHLTFNLAEGDHFLIPPSTFLLQPYGCVSSSLLTE